MHTPPSTSSVPAAVLTAEKKALPVPLVWSPPTWVMTPLSETWVGVATTKEPVVQVEAGSLVQPAALPSSKSTSTAQPPTRTAIWSEPEAPPESTTWAVMVWWPSDRVEVWIEAPVPRAPSIDELQAMAPERSPSSTSEATPVKVTLSPTSKAEPSGGAVIVTAGTLLPLKTDRSRTSSMNQPSSRTESSLSRRKRSRAWAWPSRAGRGISARAQESPCSPV